MTCECSVGIVLFHGMYQRGNVLYEYTGSTHATS